MKQSLEKVTKINFTCALEYTLSNILLEYIVRITKVITREAMNHYTFSFSSFSPSFVYSPRKKKK